jgi:hypothetical protein
MKFESSVDIQAPIGAVTALFNNPDNFKAWQDGFVSYEHISGTPRTTGAVAKVTYINRKHKIVLTETIQAMNLPTELTALYEHEHMVNTMTNSFTELPGQMTRYTTGVGYVKYIGFLPKLMALLMPGMAKKHNQKWIENFKAFAEKEYKKG